MRAFRNFKNLKSWLKGLIFLSIIVPLFLAFQNFVKPEPLDKYAFTTKAMIMNPDPNDYRTIGFDASKYGVDDENFVRLLYASLLRRAPDAGGYNYWVNTLATRAITREALANAFRASEYAQLEPISDEEFVTGLYFQFLNREADIGGYNFWLGQLKSGAMNRETVVKNFKGSAEARSRCPGSSMQIIHACDRIKRYSGDLFKNESFLYANSVTSVNAAYQGERLELGACYEKYDHVRTGLKLLQGFWVGDNLTVDCR
jgi:hypothetical protein